MERRRGGVREVDVGGEDDMGWRRKGGVSLLSMEMQGTASYLVGVDAKRLLTVCA